MVRVKRKWSSPWRKIRTGNRTRPILCLYIQTFLFLFILWAHQTETYLKLISSHCKMLFQTETRWNLRKPTQTYVRKFTEKQYLCTTKRTQAVHNERWTFSLFTRAMIGLSLFPFGESVFQIEESGTRLGSRHPSGGKLFKRKCAINNCGSIE